MGGVELDQATGRRLLVKHLGPCGRAVCRRQTAKRKAWLSTVGSVVLFDGQDPLDEILAQRHWHDLARKHAGAVALRHAVLIIDFHTE